jgi:hypothetical protein
VICAMTLRFANANSAVITAMINIGTQKLLFARRA